MALGLGFRAHRSFGVFWKIDKKEESKRPISLWADCQVSFKTRLVTPQINKNHQQHSSPTFPETFMFFVLYLP